MGRIEFIVIVIIILFVIILFWIIIINFLEKKGKKQIQRTELNHAFWNRVENWVANNEDDDEITIPNLSFQIKEKQRNNIRIKKANKEFEDFIIKKKKENTWLREYVDGSIIFLKKNEDYFFGVTNTNLSGTTRNLVKDSVQDYNPVFEKHYPLEKPSKETCNSWNYYFEKYKNFKHLYKRDPRKDEPYYWWIQEQKWKELSENQEQRILSINPNFFLREKVYFGPKTYIKGIDKYRTRKDVILAGSLSERDLLFFLNDDLNYFA